MDKKIAVSIWLSRGIEMFYLGFKLDGYWDYYQPFFDYMGLELFGKAYILAFKATEYETLSFQPAKQKIEEITKSYGHDLKVILRAVTDFLGVTVNDLLTRDFDGYSGNQIVDILKAGFFEIRYPVANPISNRFPIKGTDMHWLPLRSSGLNKFAYSVAREILYDLKKRFKIGITKSEIERHILAENSGVRFCRLFFNDTIEKYTI